MRILEELLAPSGVSDHLRRVALRGLFVTTSASALSVLLQCPQFLKACEPLRDDDVCRAVATRLPQDWNSLIKVLFSLRYAIRHTDCFTGREDPRRRDRGAILRRAVPSRCASALGAQKLLGDGAVLSTGERGAPDVHPNAPLLGPCHAAPP